ncbi:MAG: TolC family protein, partial [Gammaproteobacteria bacterium]
MSTEALQQGSDLRDRSFTVGGQMLILTAVLLITAPIVQADTLEQAFAQAYNSNAAIQAQQAELKASGYQVEQAQAGYKPQINLDAGIGTAHNDLASPFFPISTYPQNTKSVALTITQPLYTGGQVSSHVDAAQSAQAAQMANLNAAEERVFLNVATVYTDVVRDQAVLKLEQGNVEVLKKQLNATQAQFQNGEVTHTDVAQAEARLAGADAALIQAQGSLATSQAAYVRVVGVEPGALEQAVMPESLPAAETQAVQLAQKNYSVLAARYAENAAQQQAEAVGGKQKPSL